MSRELRLCAWCLLFVAGEVALYVSYRGHDARFHWFTHFFVGAAAALLAMTVFALWRQRPAPYPLVWVLVGHVLAAAPDLAFIAGVEHQRWMDVFLGHLASHYVPGRNLTWYAAFLATLAGYLVAVDRVEARSRR
ncbi:MAG: hypothetical protein ACT4PW_14135 [Acidimicrobiia bacterium]